MARVKGGLGAKKRHNRTLKLANVDLNRKVLADMAVTDAAGFAKLVEVAKSKLA